MTDDVEVGASDLQLSSETVDRWIVRNRILAAVRDELPHLHGTVLDLGCGRQPYREMFLAAPSRAERVIGVDLPSAERYGGHDIAWDGLSLPIGSARDDHVVATEVLEHCPDPGAVLAEAHRVLRPGGRFFFTVPFLWPLHDAPHDEYRYTPFALQRLLTAAGFAEVQISPFGGWDASLAQMLGLWARRRPMGARKRAVLSWAAVPLVRALEARDRRPSGTPGNVMLTGMSGTAVKPS